MDEPSISVVESSPRMAAAVRRHTAVDTIVALTISSPVWTQMGNRGMATTGRVINIFWGNGEQDFLSEAGVPADLGAEVIAPFSSDATLACVSTPSGRAATAQYRGPYERGVPATHQAIIDWCAQQGHSRAGPAWEIHTWSDDPELRLAEVFYLLG